MSSTTIYRDQLSVIVRTMAGREAFLDECLSALGAQHYNPIEVIVVLQQLRWDEQQQSIARVVDKYADQFLAAVLLSHVNTADARSKSLNLGIAAATGRYLAFCDDDDVVYLRHYMDLISAIRGGNDRTWAYADTKQVVSGSNGVTQTLHPRTRLPYSYARLIGANFIPLHSFVIDRHRLRTLPRFNENRNILEDYEFLLHVGYEHEPSYVPHTGCEYRIRSDQTNTVPNGNFRKRLLWLRAELSLGPTKRRLLRRWHHDRQRTREPSGGLLKAIWHYGVRTTKCYLMLFVTVSVLTVSHSTRRP